MADDLDARVIGEEKLEPLTDNLLIVGDENSNHAIILQLGGI